MERISNFRKYLRIVSKFNTIQKEVMGIFINRLAVYPPGGGV